MAEYNVMGDKVNDVPAPKTLSVNQRQAGTATGSTNTLIIRYLNALVALGAGITYQASSANGDSFLINEAGIYSVSVTMANYNGMAMRVMAGPTLTQSINQIYEIGRLDFIADEVAMNTTWVGYIPAGYVVYVWANNTPFNDEDGSNQITVARVG